MGKLRPQAQRTAPAKERQVRGCIHTHPSSQLLLESEPDSPEGLAVIHQGGPSTSRPTWGLQVSHSQTAELMGG